MPTSTGQQDRTKDPSGLRFTRTGSESIDSDGSESSGGGPGAFPPARGPSGLSCGSRDLVADSETDDPNDRQRGFRCSDSITGSERNLKRTGPTRVAHTGRTGATGLTDHSTLNRCIGSYSPNHTIERSSSSNPKTPKRLRRRRSDSEDTEATRGETARQPRPQGTAERTDCAPLARGGAGFPRAPREGAGVSQTMTWSGTRPDHGMVWYSPRPLCGPLSCADVPPHPPPLHRHTLTPFLALQVTRKKKRRLLMRARARGYAGIDLGRSAYVAPAKDPSRLP